MFVYVAYMNEPWASKRPKPFLFYNGNDAATLGAMTVTGTASKAAPSNSDSAATMMMIADHRRRRSLSPLFFQAREGARLSTKHFPLVPVM